MNAIRTQERSLLIARGAIDAATCDLLTRAGAIEAFTPPTIGQYWPGQGGIYAGLVRGDAGTPDYHLILADAKPKSTLDWKAAKAWASTVAVDGRTDFALPNRRESSVLFANLGDQFERRWHWTREEYSASYAWGCYFHDGNQLSLGKSYAGCARAVRRFAA